MYWSCEGFFFSCLVVVCVSIRGFPVTDVLLGLCYGVVGVLVDDFFSPTIVMLWV